MAEKLKSLQSSVRGASSFKGIREVKANIARILNRTTGQEVKKVYMEAGLALRDRARQLAPYDPKRKKGTHLRDAIFADYGTPTKSNVIVGVQYFFRGSSKAAAAPHGHLVEFGTVKMAPRPFMRPAITAMKSTMRDIIERGLKKIITRAAVE